MGRTPTYGLEVRNEVLRLIADGVTSRAIGRMDGMPNHATIGHWIDTDPEFAERYARARSQGHDVMAEQLLDIADDQKLPPDSRRVMVDARKWLLAKLKPGKYGDKVQLAGDGGGPIKSESLVTVEFVGGGSPEMP